MNRIVLAGLGVMAAAATATAAVTGVTAQAPDAAQGRAAPPAQQAFFFGSGAALGVSVRDLSSDELSRARLPQAGGVLIESVRDGSPAAQAGLRTGDIVVEFDGERVRGVRHFTRLVQETPAGRTVTTAIVREGMRQTLDVTPETRTARTLLPDLSREIERSVRAFEFDMPRAVIIAAGGRLGATLLPLDDQLAAYFGVEEGVLVSSVDPASPAEQAGLRAGDVITRVNERRVTAPGDVNSEIRRAEAGATLELGVMRDRKETTLRATVPERTPAAARRGRTVLR